MPTVLITGANRGIGLDFTKLYAKQGWDVIATVRSLSSAQKVEGNVEWVKLESESLTDAGDIAKQLKEKGVKPDVVIANAAINSADEVFAEVDPTNFDKHLNVNVRGVLVLFQAMKPLLGKDGKFIAISSGAGTINRDSSQPGMGTYGLTKAALNFLIRQMHFENPDLLIAGLNPGWVATDMGSYGANFRGIKEGPPDDITKTVPGMMKVIEEGDKAKIGGYMTNWDGTRMSF